MSGGATNNRPYSVAADFINIKKSEINTMRDYRGRVALHLAAKDNNLLEIKRLLSLGAEIDMTDKDGKTPLHSAICANKVHSHFDAIELLLKRGADVNIIDNHGKTPLHFVGKQSSVKIAQLLLDHKAAINVKDNCGFIPLVYAINYNKMEIFQLLIDYGSDISSVSKEGLTPLHIAADCSGSDSHLKIIEILLKNGAGVDAKTSCGKTPLHCLTGGYSNVKSVKLLLSFKANVNLQNKDGEIPLFNAVGKENIEIIQILLDHGSDSKNINLNQSTLLHKSAQTHERLSSLKIAEILLKRGVDINAKDNFGKTALHYLAVKDNFLKTAQLFLNYKADVNIKDDEGKIPLYYAVTFRHTKLVQSLVENGSDLNNIRRIHAKHGSTVLHWACMFCKVETIIALLKDGANINETDYQGLTPLNHMLLRYYKNYETKDFKIKLKFLLKHVDVNMVDSRGNDILYYSSNGHTNKIIIEHIAKLHELDALVNPRLLVTILDKDDYKKYFEKCIEELATAKISKLKNSWITFFNLLVDNNRKLKNYAGNHDISQDLKTNDWKKKFPIYGGEMQENMQKGKKIRKLFEKSAGTLSNHIPIFGPSHLIIRNTLDFLTFEDYNKLSSFV